MGLEDYVPSAETGAESGPKSSEVSEKFKESVKRAGAGIKRVQKDEKKAQKYDSLLAAFLVQIVKDKKYDFLLETLFKSLDSGYSSNFLLGILSLIYRPISDKIRELSSKPKINIICNKHFSKINFDNNSLNEEIKKRINLWIEDIIDVLSIEYSSMQTKRILNLFKNNDTIIVEFTSLVFAFFFFELNIEISKAKSSSYSKFILGEVKTKIEKLELEDV